MNLFRRPPDDEIDEELQSHILLRADDLERVGLSRPEAERRARTELGGALRYREECQDAAGGTGVESVVQDLRYGTRVLRKAPGFTGVAVLTIALAIGANVVLFAALNAIILRPLDLPQPESLYSVHRIAGKSAAQSYPDYIDLRDRNTSFDGLAAYDFILAGFDSGTSPTRSWGIAASGNYFDVLRVQPYLGRLFHAADEHGPNSAPEIVLTYAFWHSHFRSDPSVIGRVVQLNKHPYTIIGVTPPNFHGTLLFFWGDFFVPLVNREEIVGTPFMNDRGNRVIFMTLGHLKPGVTPGQAAADLDAISTRLEQDYPKEHKHAAVSLARPNLYGDYVGGPARAFLTALMLLGALILVAACANLGSLFAARAADRSREIALRLALGAGRFRIVRQLLTEAILMSVAGGALGLCGGLVVVRWLAAWQPFPQYPINIPVSPDARVVVVAAVLAIASGLFFGAVPIRQALRTDPYEVVKSTSRTTVERRFTFRDALVVAQIAICAVLVTASLVAVRGLTRSLHAHFGFDPENVLLAETVLDMAGYRGGEVAPMQKRMLEAVQAIPGVAAAGLISWPPLATGGGDSASVYDDAGAEFTPRTAAATALHFRVSPGYLASARTTLLAGRMLTDHDDTTAPRVAIVNTVLAQRLFGSPAAAVGHYFRFTEATRVQVVGVVETGKYATLTEVPQPAVFVPLSQSPSSDTWLVVRASGDPQPIAGSLRTALHDLDAGLPVTIESWSSGMDLVLFPARVASVSLGVLGLMGAVLSLSGVFGIAAYSVSRRMREFGIRIALGAQRKSILSAALGRALRLLAVGSAVGVALGVLGARVLAFIVYDATPRDPLVLGGVLAVMFALGLLATWIPAQRALSIDPLSLLRQE